MRFKHNQRNLRRAHLSMRHGVYLLIEMELILFLASYIPNQENCTPSVQDDKRQFITPKLLRIGIKNARAVDDDFLACLPRHTVTAVVALVREDRI